MNAHFRVCWSCQLAALRRVDRVFRAEFESRSNPSTRGWGTGLGWIQMSNPYPNPRLTRTLTRGFPIPVMIPSTDMRRSHAQEALDQTVYAEDSDIQEHIKLLRTRKVAVDNLSNTAMADETWKGIVIRSIPPTTKWLPVISSLYMMTTTADVFSSLIAHGMILDR